MPLHLGWVGSQETSLPLHCTSPTGIDRWVLPLQTQLPPSTYLLSPGLHCSVPQTLGHSGAWDTLVELKGREGTGKQI